MTTQVVVEPGIYLGVPILCQWLLKPPQCLHMNSELILSLLCLENRVLRHSSWRGHFENMGSECSQNSVPQCSEENRRYIQPHFADRKPEAQGT